jgi:hypothetical protein
LIKKDSKLTKTSVQSQISKSEFKHDVRKDTIISQNARKWSSAKEIKHEIKHDSVNIEKTVADEIPPPVRSASVLTEVVPPPVPEPITIDTDTPSPTAVTSNSGMYFIYIYIYIHIDMYLYIFFI